MNYAGMDRDQPAPFNWSFATPIRLGDSLFTFTGLEVREAGGLKGLGVFATTPLSEGLAIPILGLPCSVGMGSGMSDPRVLSRDEVVIGPGWFSKAMMSFCATAPPLAGPGCRLLSLCMKRLSAWAGLLPATTPPPAGGCVRAVARSGHWSALPESSLPAAAPQPAGAIRRVAARTVLR